MKVKIGSVTIPDATVKRFIDLQSGLPLSMIELSYLDPVGIGHRELIEAFKNNTILLFQSDILKTLVQIHSSGYDKEARKRKFILQERDVSSGYKLLHIKAGNDYRFLVPENIKQIEAEQLGTLPYIRFILKKDIPKEWFE